MAGAEDLSEDVRQLREDVARLWRLVEDYPLDSDTKCMLRKELQVIEERMVKDLTNATAARIRLIRGRLNLAQETAELAINELQELPAAQEPSETQAAGSEPVNRNNGNSVNITAKHKDTRMPQQAAAMVGPEVERLQAASVNKKQQAAGKQVESEEDTMPTTSRVQENKYGTLLALAEVTHAASSKAATLHVSPAAESTTSLSSARDMKAVHQDTAPASNIQPADAVQVDLDDDGLEDMPLSARMKRVAGTPSSKSAAGGNAASKDTKPSAVQQVDDNDKDEEVSLAKRRKLSKLTASAASDMTEANMAGMQALLQLADTCNRRVGEAANGSADDKDVKIEELESVAVDDDDDNDEEPGDNLCSWCDDGGMLIGCEGECWRSFHAVEGQGADGCPTLHMSLETYEEYQTDKTKRWLCADCENEYHMCYECKEYGDAAEGPKQEVFKCEYYGCGKYYHPACFTGSKAVYGRKLSARIKSRLSTASATAPDDEYEQAFFCPLHSCHTCKNPSKEPDSRLICCRRCSTAFHEQCLPRELAIATDAVAFSPLKQRVWLSKEIWCLYCTLHPLLAKYGRPKTMRLLKPPDRKLQQKLQHMLEQQRKKEAQQRELLKTQSTSVPPSEGPQKETFDLNQPPVEVEKPSEILPDPEALKAALDRLEHIEAKVEKEVTLQMVSKSIRRSVIYDTIEKSGGRRVITTLKLRQIKQTCANAKKAWQARRFDEARQLMSHQLLRDLSSSEGPLRVWLSPYMHRNRFTSFGRHFTTDQKLREVAMRMSFVIHEGDTVVDFCCGANHWSVFLAEQCRDLGHRNVSFRNFDLFKSENSFCFEQRDWFEVKSGDLPPGEKLVIGLNPPFGTQCALAHRFVAHAIEFKPRVIALIVPRETRHPPAMDCNGAPGYSLLEENRTLLGGHAFYIPGSYDANTDAPFLDWNKDPPSFRLYIRNDMVSQETAAWQRLDMVAPYFEEVMPSPMPGYSPHEPYFPAGFLPQ